MNTANHQCDAASFVIFISLVFLACNGPPAPTLRYEWARFSEDLSCRNELTGQAQCFRIEVALRRKVESRGKVRSVDSTLPPAFRELIRLRLESSGMIPVDFDDAAEVGGLRRDLTIALDAVVDSPRINVDLKSCGERVEDMTEDELKRIFDQMDEETKKKLTTLPPTLGYADND